jgi:hypothetical protein
MNALGDAAVIAPPSLGEQAALVQEWVGSVGRRLVGPIDTEPSTDLTSGEVEVLVLHLPARNGRQLSPAATLAFYLNRIGREAAVTRTQGLQWDDLHYRNGSTRPGMQRVALRPTAFWGEDVPTIGEAMSRSEDNDQLPAGVEVLAYVAMTAYVAMDMDGSTFPFLNLPGLRMRVPGRDDIESMPCLHRPDGKPILRLGANHPSNSLRRGLWAVPTYRAVGPLVGFR